jgi:hypothetical protein
MDHYSILKCYFLTEKGIRAIEAEKAPSEKCFEKTVLVFLKCAVVDTPLHSDFQRLQRFVYSHYLQFL